MKQVNTWAPILKDDEEPTLSLMVRCGDHPPNQQEYRSRLGDAMEAFIKQDPKLARKDIGRSVRSGQPRFLVSLLSLCPLSGQTNATSPQMAMLLHRTRLAEDQPRPKAVGGEPARLDGYPSDVV